MFGTVAFAEKSFSEYPPDVFLEALLTVSAEATAQSEGQTVTIIPEVYISGLADVTANDYQLVSTGSGGISCLSTAFYQTDRVLNVEGSIEGTSAADPAEGQIWIKIIPAISGTSSVAGTANGVGIADQEGLVGFAVVPAGTSVFVAGAAPQETAGFAEVAGAANSVAITDPEQVSGVSTISTVQSVLIADADAEEIVGSAVLSGIDFKVFYLDPTAYNKKNVSLVSQPDARVVHIPKPNKDNRLSSVGQSSNEYRRVGVA